MTSRIEALTYRIVIAISVLLVAATGSAIIFFHGMSGDHDEVLAAIQANADRLDALESKKSPATAKRFTSDDAQDLIACLRLPKAEQRPCLDAIQSRFTGRTSTQQM